MRRSGGFTLVELMVVVAIIAIVATTALPRFLASRLSANEAAAVSTLRNVLAAQVQFQRMGAVDTDFDGLGEFGYLGELAGSADLRDFTGPSSGHRLAPPVLPASLGRINAAGHVADAGYVFLAFLPGFAGLPLAEDAGGGSAAGAEDPALSSQFFVCYAWPNDFEKTGRRAYVMTEQGELLQCDNDGVAGHYSGDTHPAAVIPAGDAAFVLDEDMTSGLALQAIGQDGNRWKIVQ